MRTKRMLTICAFSFLLLGAAKCQNAHNEEPEELSEEKVSYDALPGSVRNAFEGSEYEGLEKEEVEKVKTEKKGTLYEIEVRKENGKIQELYYDKKGSLIHSHEED